MGLARSTYYETPRAAVDDTAIVEAMATICDAFEAYGRRRVGAALRRQLDRSSPERIARALLWTSKS